MKTRFLSDSILCNLNSDTIKPLVAYLVYIILNLVIMGAITLCLVDHEAPKIVGILIVVVLIIDTFVATYKVIKLHKLTKKILW